MKEKYEQFLPIHKIIEILDDNFRQYHKPEECTVSTTTVPLVTIGKYGSFSIKVRLAQFGNNPPRYDAAAVSSSSHYGVIGHNLEHCIELAVKEARLWYEKFYSENPDLL